MIIEGNIVGSVFVHKMLSDLNGSMVDMYRQIIFSALMSIVVAVILIYFMAKSILKPLKTGHKSDKNSWRTEILTSGLRSIPKTKLENCPKHSTRLRKTWGKYENTRRGFVANVSHELRSPLTSMQGLVQGILDGTIPNDQQENYLSVVLDETKRLNYLINDLLDLSQIESGKIAFEFKNIDINELIRRCLITFESKISAKNIEVEVEIKDEKQFVSADENRIKQVMINLIDNAVKFTPEGGTIKIFTSETTASIFVNVNNSGGVIEKEDLPYVFERFYKAG